MNKNMNIILGMIIVMKNKTNGAWKYIHIAKDVTLLVEFEDSD